MVIFNGKASLVVVIVHEFRSGSTPAAARPPVGAQDRRRHFLRPEKSQTIIRTAGRDLDEIGTIKIIRGEVMFQIDWR